MPLLLRSAWNWDLWAALVVGMVVAVVASTVDFQPKREWIYPVLIVSCTVCVMAVNQRNNLRTRLRGTNYGELLRITDQSETEVRMPYEVTLWSAVVSVIWSLLTTIVIESVSLEWAVTTMLTIWSAVFVWSCGAMLSVLRLSSSHDRYEAEIESMKEALESQLRCDQTEQQRTGVRYR